MRLLKLSANVGSFRTVKFNRTGLSFVLAEQKAPRTNRTKTYNGVGKSLMLAILDYCLGSNVAKAEMEVGLQALMKTLPGMRLAVEPAELTFTRGEMITMLTALPVTW